MDDEELQVASMGQGRVELVKFNLALARDFVGQMKRDGHSHDGTFTMRESLHRRPVDGDPDPHGSVPTFNEPKGIGP